MSGFSDMGIRAANRPCPFSQYPYPSLAASFTLCAHPMRTFMYVLLLLFTTVPAHAAADAQWLEVRSPHFVILTDSNEKQARKLAGQFERMRSFFQTILPHAGGDDNLPITVLALKDKKGFQSLVPAAYLAKGQLQLDGLFLRTQDRNYILLRLDAQSEHPFSVVYHEYTHFVLRKFEALPTWLNEGLAEFYQNTDIDEKDVKLGQPSVDDILYLRQNRLLPLTTLFAVDHDSPYYHDEQKGSVFYAQSWALTHYIEVTDYQNKAHRLQDYTQFIAHNEDPVTAAQHAFGNLGQLQKELDKYVSGASYLQFNLKSTFTADEASFPSRPMSISDVNAVRASVLANDDRRPEAQALLDAILRDNPKNALACETMGSLAFRDHDIAAARKWYGEAVQLDSESYVAHYNYAIFSLMDNDTNHDDAIEASLRQAIKLAPSFAPPYDALARFYGMRHKNLDDAHLLEAQAIQLEPADIQYRVNAAQIAMEQQNIDNALNILAAAKKIAANASETAMVDQQIQHIQDYKTQLERFHNRDVAESTVETITLNDTPSDDTQQPPYPDTPPPGPHHTVKGVLHGVKCSYPTVITLTLAPAGKPNQPAAPVTLYSNNFYKVAFTLANFTQTSDIDPCKDIDGMKAQIEYATVTDKRVAGQIVAIELSK